MRVRPVSVLLLGAAVVLSACQRGPTQVVCTADLRPGILLDVRDSVNNVPAGRGARIIAQDGAYADTVKNIGSFDGPYQLAQERAGTYTVTVEQQGYRLWRRSGVEVTADQCHVRTVSLTARLQP